MDAVLLERLRRGFKLHMSRTGAFDIAGEPITHPRILTALRRGLDRNDDGEFIVHFGEQWTYIRVDDCPLRVAKITGEPPQSSIHLDDGRDLPLPWVSLWEEPDQGLRCSVPSVVSGRPLPARFTNTAQMDLAPYLEVDQQGRVMVRHGAQSFAIPTVPLPPST